MLQDYFFWRFFSSSFFVYTVTSCVIQGTDSGECISGDVFTEKAPFCAPTIQNTIGGAKTYQVCVPKEYKWYPNLTLSKKDKWMQDTYEFTISRRRAIELDGGSSLLPIVDGTWEGGMLPKGSYHFVDNDDCAAAYKNFLCYMNFPRCDDTGGSLAICRTVCQNYFRACKIIEDLQRCDNPEYYGAKYQEADDVLDNAGVSIYSRYFFPGMPFVDIKYERKPQFIEGTLGQALTPLLTVCTPSIPGGSISSSPELLVIVIAIFCSLIVVLF